MLSIKQLKQFKRTNYYRSGIEESIYRLRNIGLVDPDRVIRELENLRGCWWYDGCYAEAATSVIYELNIVKKCKGL